MPQLVHCIYASRASPSFEEHDIPALLEAARRNNASLGITGVLLYVEGNFFQVLEGEAAAVAEVFGRIRDDNRHGRVTQIISEPIFERVFTDWTMGFANVNFAELKSHIGENDFFTSATCLEQLGPGRARKLLDAFRQGRWRADQTGAHRAHGRMA
ncbi:MAG: BLUF domain-containing protein [Steroidobacteraceae bacterium]